MNKEKIFSFLKWASGTILIGALGSGLWELFLSDFLSWLAYIVIEIAGAFSAEFKDSLYDRVSNGPIASILRVPLVLIIATAITIPIAMLLFALLLRLARAEKNTSGAESSDDGEREIRHNAPIAAMSLFIVFICFITFQSLYMAKAASFIEKSIEIVAPHIEERSRLELRAQYRSIKNAESYHQLYSQLRDLEKRLDVKLPEFDPI
ncbi:hypothetical protein VU12_14345 [Desulfobulbus sp. US4]|nr:hypothetical protein [Desulfobulbus sp. US4]